MLNNPTFVKEMNAASSYSSAVIKKSDPNIKKGLVIVVGQILKDDGFSINNERFASAIENYDKHNVLLINFSGQNLSLDEFQTKLAEFANDHEDISIISGIHGFHIVPTFNHELIWGPVEKNEDQTWTYIQHLLHLNENKFITTKDYFQAIVDACQEKLTNVWQTSCQANQIIFDVKDILPKGVALYTESDGYILEPSNLFASLESMLHANKEIDFDSLLTKELYFLSSIDYNGNALNYNPTKTINGEKIVEYTAQADKLLQHLNSDDIPQLAHRIFENGPVYSYNYIEKRLKYFGENKKDGSMADCFVNQGTGSYLVEAIIKESLADVMDWLGLNIGINTFNSAFKNTIQTPEGCPVKNQQEYAELLTYAASLGDDNKDLPEFSGETYPVIHDEL